MLWAALLFVNFAMGHRACAADTTIYHQKLSSAYDVIAATPFPYHVNEIELYGREAEKLSGNARLYALWRVLYAYKNIQNTEKLQEWRARASRIAMRDNDSELDMLSRFMVQANDHEINGFSVLTEREWQLYLNAPNPVIHNIVELERERELQYNGQWAAAIDLGEALIVRLQAAGKQAEPLLNVAQQTLAYNMLKVGDYNAYADHALAMAQLSRGNAFFIQKMDMVYDLAFLAAQNNNENLALKFQKLYAGYVHQFNVTELKLWNEYLCAYIEDRIDDDQAVIDCLKSSSAMNGIIRNGYDASNLHFITKAYARLYKVDLAEKYLSKLQAVPEAILPRDPIVEKYVEAYIKAGRGDQVGAFHDLGAWALLASRDAQTRRVAAVQDMYQALRKELDSQTAESRLLIKQAKMRNMLLGAAGLIAFLLASLVVGGALWVFRMRRMQWHLRDAQAHAEAANAAKSRFLAVMSHELRTPLNGVLGMAQALKNENLTHIQKDQVNILVDSGQTLLVLLNDVLDMSRIEAGKIELSPTPSTLKDMMERVVNTYSTLLTDKDVTLRYDIDENARIPMSFDILRVYQCLSNLVSNALKFTEKGTVRIYASAEHLSEGGYRVRAEVRDSGIGMNKATLDKVFEPFTQANPATAQTYGGTGLGLNISRHLANLMGGDLTVTSTEGVGSCFVMTFIANEVMTAPQAKAKPVAKNESLQDENADLPGAKILLVDDHPVNRKVARLFLEPLGFVITEAVDGQEALDLDMSRYDLVLMDLNMPRLGGLEATRLFRAQEAAGKHVPIVALTADAMQDQVKTCYEAGMDAHIAKPIIMETLITTVCDLLRVKEDGSAARTKTTKST
ncbi:MAG: ATP-binding protein [Asticcacaulis sp.]